MIAIVETPDIAGTPNDRGDAFNLMTILLQARQAAEAWSSHAKLAEESGNEFLASFYNEIASLQMDVLRRTWAEIERLRNDAEEGPSGKCDPITAEPRTAHRRKANQKKMAR